MVRTDFGGSAKPEKLAPALSNTVLGNTGLGNTGLGNTLCWEILWLGTVPKEAGDRGGQRR